jgi:hypothetical protein
MPALSLLRIDLYNSHLTLGCEHQGERDLIRVHYDVCSPDEDQTHWERIPVEDNLVFECSLDDNQPLSPEVKAFLSENAQKMTNMILSAP